jgi:hypothetical protein
MSGSFDCYSKHVYDPSEEDYADYEPLPGIAMILGVAISLIVLSGFIGWALCQH